MAKREYEKIDMDPDKEGEDFEDRGDMIDDEDPENEEYDELDLDESEEDLDEEDADEEDDGEDFDEEDEDSEEDFDEEEEDSDSQDPKDIRIPKERFDEVIAQREEARERERLLTKQMEQLIDMVQDGRSTAKQSSEPEKEKFEYDFDAREADYMEAVLEGETKKAAEIRKEIRGAERKMYQLEQEDLVSKATESARSEARKLEDQARFDSLVTKAEKEYPFFNQTSDDYNQEAVDKVNNLFNKLVKAGSSKTEALQEAIELVAPVYHTPAKEKSSRAPLGGKRRQKQLKRNARANNSQPPRMKGKTSRDKSVDEYNVLNMTDAEFSKLPASIKRKLRGD